MTKHLSPAALAVIAAYNKEARPEPHHQCEAIAAAIRAAADQVVPVAECRKDPSDNCCERSVKQERSDIRILLRAIADELEGL